MAERHWRVPAAVVAAKWAGAVAAAALAAVSAGDRQLLLLAGAAALFLAVLAVRDLIAPVRVAADGEAVTVVAGYAGRRRIPWDEVVAVRVDERRRLLHRTRLLEIEIADDLHLFSRFDLGSEVEDVADALDALRYGSSSGVG